MEREKNNIKKTGSGNSIILGGARWRSTISCMLNANYKVHRKVYRDFQPCEVRERLLCPQVLQMGASRVGGGGGGGCLGECSPENNFKMCASKMPFRPF